MSNSSKTLVGGNDDSQSTRREMPINNVVETNKNRWATVIIRFNLDPASYAHQSWLPTWVASASSQSLSNLSQFLLIENGLENLFDWQMKSRIARLFLIEPRELENIALILGITAHRDKLRRVVRKEHILQMQSSIGTAIDTLWQPFAQTVPSAETSLELHFEKIALNSDAIIKDLKTTGYQYLAQLLNSSNIEERAAALRAKFCLPKATQHIEMLNMSLSQRNTLANSIIDIVIPQRAATWTWLF